MDLSPDTSERPPAHSGGSARHLALRALVSLGFGVLVLLGWSAAASAGVEPVAAQPVPAVPAGVPALPAPTPPAVQPPVGAPADLPDAPVAPALTAPPTIDLPVVPAPEVPDLPSTADLGPLDDTVPAVEELAAPATARSDDDASPAATSTPTGGDAPASARQRRSDPHPVPVDHLVADLSNQPGIVALAPSSGGDEHEPSGRPTGPPSAPFVLPACGVGSSAGRAPAGESSSATLGSPADRFRAVARALVTDREARCSSIARARPEVAPD